MTTVTASELLILDKRRFEQEYYKWQEYCLDYEWWDYIYDNFKATCEACSVRIDDITFSGFHSQGSGAAFQGRIDLTALMEREGLDVKYPALYIGVKNDGSYFLTRPTRNNSMRGGNYEMYANQTAPDGVFSGLDQQAWEELIEEQDRDADLEERALEFARHLADELYTNLESEYEHLTSEASFIESCECNEVTFEITTEEETA
jgi:hypothetical protein